MAKGWFTGRRFRESRLVMMPPDVHVMFRAAHWLAHGDLMAPSLLDMRDGPPRVGLFDWMDESVAGHWLVGREFKPGDMGLTSDMAREYLERRWPGVVFVLLAHAADEGVIRISVPAPTADGLRDLIAVMRRAHPEERVIIAPSLESVGAAYCGAAQLDRLPELTRVEVEGVRVTNHPPELRIALTGHRLLSLRVVVTPHVLRPEVVPASWAIARPVPRHGPPALAAAYPAWHAMKETRRPPVPVLRLPDGVVDANDVFEQLLAECSAPATVLPSVAASWESAPTDVVGNLRAARATMERESIGRPGEPIDEADTPFEVGPG
ncbi:MAG TPA: hypothetical protein VD866_04570 [Urbifossiella sp.]|nr:hypothetical protein [Urbifossiella sp.]